MNAVVKIKNVHKSYGSGAGLVHALWDINVDIKAGEFVALHGPSGSGKTTLLNLIGALDQPSQGSIVIEGLDLATASAPRLAKLRRERIGFVFQAHNLIPILTAYENAEFTLALQRRPKAERYQRTMRALEQVGLSDFAHRLPAELSGGQQQRVAIARAIAPEPAIVLADEPTASLDSKVAHNLLDLMQKLNAEQGVTFVFSTHDPKVMARAGRLLPMADGRFIA